MELLEVKLKPLEEKVYNENFKKYLSRRKFKILISKSVLSFYMKDSEITKSGNSFNCIYYIALIDPTYEVVLMKDGVDLYPLKENSWVGIIEYMKYLNVDKREMEANRKKIRTDAHIMGYINSNWGVDCIIRKSEYSIPITQERRNLFELYPAACWVYSFNLLELEELYNENDGFNFRNILYSFWLYYTTKAVINVDKQLGIIKNEVDQIQVQQKGIFNFNLR